MLAGYSSVRMLFTSGALTMMNSPSRFRFAHCLGPYIDQRSRVLFDPELTSKRPSYFWTNPKDRVAALLAQYQRRALEPQIEKELRSIVEREARRAGMSELPRTEIGCI
jgi:hypothetical protein